MNIDPLTLLRCLRNPDEAIDILAPIVLPRVAEYCVDHYLPAAALAKAGALAERYDQGREQLLDHIADAPSGLYVILGGPGTGKTCFALALAEHIARPTFVANVPAGVLPKWVQPLEVEKIGELAPGSVVIVDDAGQVASSRDYQSAQARALEDLLGAYRHKDLVLIVTTTASNTVHTALLDASVFFVKPPTMFRRAAERRELRWLLDLAADAWAQVGEAERKNHAFAVSEDPPFAGFISYDLPYGWTEGLSKNKAAGPPQAVRGSP